MHKYWSCLVIIQNRIQLLIKALHDLVSLVGKVPVYHAGGSGSIPSRTNALKYLRRRPVLPLL